MQTQATIATTNEGQNTKTRFGIFSACRRNNLSLISIIKQTA
ncbi:MAG: hypothetical protein ACJAV6_000054 [Candidatus Paceibacteria bacterium]|jgi:hypothetical protein